MTPPRSVTAPFRLVGTSASPSASPVILPGALGGTGRGRVPAHDALQRPPRAEPPPRDLRTRLITPTKRGRVRAGEGDVGHVEAPRMDGVRTPIPGRARPPHRERRRPGDPRSVGPQPRPPHRERRADPDRTLKCEGPGNPLANTRTGRRRPTLHPRDDPVGILDRPGGEISRLTALRPSTPR